VNIFPNSLRLGANLFEFSSLAHFVNPLTRKHSQTLRELLHLRTTFNRTEAATTSIEMSFEITEMEKDSGTVIPHGSGDDKQKIGNVSCFWTKKHSSETDDSLDAADNWSLSEALV